MWSHLVTPWWGILGGFFIQHKIGVEVWVKYFHEVKNPGKNFLFLKSPQGIWLFMPLLHYSEKYKIKDLNSFTYDRHIVFSSFPLIFLSAFPHTLPPRVLAQCVYNAKRESRVFLFIDLFYIVNEKKISFGLLFLFTFILLLLPFPPSYLTHSLSRSMRVENVYTQCSTLASTRYSPMNGETELKTYFVGDLKHNAVNYDFFSLTACVFIRDFLFSRSFRYFFLSFSREFELWFNELAKKICFITIYCCFFGECCWISIKN